MLYCKIEPLSAYRLRVTGSAELLETLYFYMRGEKESRYPVRRFGRTVWKTEVKKVNLCQRDKGLTSLIAPRGYFFFIAQHLSHLKKKYEIKVDNLIDIKGDLVLTEKWDNILREDQKGAFKTVVALKGSCLQLNTGSGKSEVVLSIVSSFAEAMGQFNNLSLTPRKVLITSPKDAVCDELRLRFSKWGMESYLQGENPLVKIVNPLGLMRSYLIQEPSFLSWLNKVGLVIHDEVHRSCCDSYKDLIAKLNNLEYAYGVSATISSKRIDDTKNFDVFPYEAQQIIGITGPATVFKFAKDVGKEIEYYQLYGNFGKGYDEASGYDGQNYFKMVTNQTHSADLMDAIRRIITHFGNKIFYIPVNFLQAGQNIYHYLEAHGIKCIHWAGGYEILPETLTSLNDLKTAIDSGEYRVLIGTSTSSEGVDIGGLTAAVLLFGVGDNTTPQSLGRAGRRETPVIVNVFNKDHATMYKQARKRDELIKRHYSCKTTRLKL